MGAMGITLVALVVLTICGAHANPLPLPLRGWSTWNTFKCNIDHHLVESSIEALAVSPLRGAGYDYILIDDCWSKCLQYGEEGKCHKPAPRDSTGRIVVDDVKFPKGFEPLTALAHSKGLKIGIYTAVSATTCGGYMGSLFHEADDAATFASWGFDFVKHDTCNTDCGIHNGCIQNATQRMADALPDRIIYYLDSGNPTSPQRMYNPRNLLVSNKEATTKLATKPSELAWVWTNDAVRFPRGPHMVKSWYDREDTWVSVLGNLHNQVRIAEYQRCGRFNMPDMLTTGMGGLTPSEERVEVFSWAILGAPLVLGNDIRGMSPNSSTMALLTAPEILAVQQDPDCTQGSLVRSLGAIDTWARPLHDGSVAVVLVNKGETAVPGEVFLGKNGQHDFDPIRLTTASVRDIFRRSDLGLAILSHTTPPIPPHDAVFLRFSFLV